MMITFVRPVKCETICDQNEIKRSRSYVELNPVIKECFKNLIQLRPLYILAILNPAGHGYVVSQDEYIIKLLFGPF